MLIVVATIPVLFVIFSIAYYDFHSKYDKK